MPGFAGLVQLGSPIDVAIVAKNASQVPTDTDALPTYRIYSPAGILSTGSLTFKDTAAITNAPPANPTIYTSNGHGLTVGTKVTVIGITGNTAANTTGDITAVTSNTFTIAVDSSGSGAYISGGTWHATGVYDWNFTPTIGANYASGIVYSVYVYGKFTGTTTVIDNFDFLVT